MKEIATAYSKGELSPILGCMLIAAMVAAVSSLMGPISTVNNWLGYALAPMLPVVPSIPAISSGTQDSSVTELVLTIQWLFAPVYTFFWFYILPPWSRRMVQTVSNATRKFSRTRRIFSISVGIVFFSSWLLGDMGIIDFPTFYNGKYVYPIASAVPQLRLIYASPTFLAIYAWFGPLAEACIIWMLLAVMWNAKLYSLPSQPEKADFKT